MAVPTGYELRPWLPDPPTYTGGGEFESPGLVVSIYPSVADYELNDLSAILRDVDDTPTPPRYANSLRDVLFDEIPIGGLLNECLSASESGMTMYGDVPVGVSRVLSSWSEEPSFNQRAAMELRDGRLIIVTLADHGTHPLDEQRSVFESVVHSIANLN